MGDGELGCADWMGEVDVEDGVAVRCRIVFGRRFPRWMPEVREGLRERQLSNSEPIKA